MRCGIIFATFFRSFREPSVLFQRRMIATIKEEWSPLEGTSSFLFDSYRTCMKRTDQMIDLAMSAAGWHLIKYLYRRHLLWSQDLAYMHQNKTYGPCSVHGIAVPMTMPWASTLQLDAKSRANDLKINDCWSHTGTEAILHSHVFLF